MFMKRILTFTSMLGILIFLNACAGKKEVKTSTKIVIGSLAIDSQTGGVIIYGHNKVTGDSFGKIGITGPLELSNGPWEFAAISYDGNSVGNLLQGTLRCAKNEETLNGMETSVSLELNQETCKDAIFGNAGSKDASGQPYPLTLWSCMNPKAVEQRDGNECQKGVAGSHLVILPGFVNGSPTNEALVSACISHGANADQLSTIKIPYFELGATSIPFQVRSFSDSTCTTPSGLYTFTNGYKTASTPEFGTALSEAGSANNVYLFKNPCDTLQFGSGPTPFSFSHPDLGTANLVCNTSHLQTYATSNPTESFVLGQDIDFGNATITGPIVDASFTGRLIGNDFGISNLEIDCSSLSTGCGIFKSIDNAGGDRVENLRLYNISVITDSSSMNVGALAGSLTNGSSVRRILGDLIEIDVATGASSIGGLIGNIPASGGGVDSSKLTNITINLNEGLNVGGFIGSTSDNAYVRSSLVENISFVQAAEVTSGSSNIGGVVGNATGTSNRLEIWEVFVNGMYAGTPVAPLEISSGFGGVLGAATAIRFIRTGVFGTADIEATAAQLKAGGAIGQITDSFDLKNVLSEVALDTTYASGARVGGVIGDITSTVGGQASQIRNVGSVDCIGSCGGVVGLVSTNSAGTLSELINYGNITATSNNVGGVIGVATAVSVLDSVNRGNVSGVAFTGGFIGLSQANTVVNKCINGGDVTSDSASGTGGGFFGGTGGAATGVTITNSVSYGSVTATNSASVNKFIGDPQTSPTVTSSYYVDGSPTDPNGTNTDFGELTDPTSSTLGGASYGSLTDVFSNQLFIADVGGIKTTYEVAMDKLGYNLTGNKFDPLSITSEDEWNSIGDDPFLMGMAIQLDADLFFGSLNGSFIPIGSLGTNTCFSGKFFGNNHILSNIVVDESGGGTGPLGIFRALCSNATNGTTADIDHYDAFEDVSYNLYINNADFYSDSFNTGVLAGQLTDANSGSHWGTEAINIYGVFISNSSVDVSGGSGNSGGLVGDATIINQQSEFENIEISFTDVLNAGSGSAGGVLGNLSGTPSSPTMQNRFNLINYTNGTISSAGRAGGAIGYNSNKNFEVTRILVADAIITGEGAVGGIIGTSSVGGSVVEVVVKNTSLTDGNTGAYVGGIIGEYTNSIAPTLTLQGSYAFAISLAGNGNLGGLVGLTLNGGGGNMAIERNYAVIDSVTGGGTFGGIDGSGSPNATEPFDNYYYYDGSAYGSLGVNLANRADINDGSLAPDLLIGTEFLTFGLDHPQRPFEIFRFLFLE